VPSTFDRFHIHGDNIVECERTLTLIENSLHGELQGTGGPFGSPACPEFQLNFRKRPKPSRVVFFPGFHRWDRDILEHIRQRGGTLREAADIIISGVDQKGENAILAIEYCGALPAGNQAWQRSGRAYSFGLAGVPFLYVAEIGGYEIGADRQRKAPRFPNAAVPFSYLCYSTRMSAPVLAVFTPSPSADEASKSYYAAVLGESELLQVIRGVILGEDYSRQIEQLMGKVLRFVQLRATNSRGNRTLTPAQWTEAYSAIQSGSSLPQFLLREARLSWSKTAFIKDLTATAKQLMGIASQRAIGLTSTELPMCLIPKDERRQFATDVGNLYAKLRTDFSGWLAMARPLGICWVMGFKPGGDDARPDRGLPPLTRMLIGPGVDLLTVVYGPAPANTWPLLVSDPRALMKRSGLWEAAMACSDALLVDSSTDNVTQHGYLKAHWSMPAEGAEVRHFTVAAKPLRIGEQDVDTALHLLLARVGSQKVFEGMCNPPGGDWSGISLLTANGATELRWLSLPRVGGAHSKRPDHVFELFGIARGPVVLVVESKETAAAIEEGIGPRLRAYLTDLMKSPASVERPVQGSTPYAHTRQSIPPGSMEFCTSVAFLLRNADEMTRTKAKSGADIVLGFAFSDDGTACTVRAHPCTAIGSTVAKFMMSLQTSGAGLALELV
jgi:hypothetical protein